ncbi:helix-turn-helix domain-containing protein [Mangrovibacterium lignilyticum]|uniref:helix-turn-helix domain-containing protein n=1 Tax=Mangrovibacterium lignilyticum TaxID=2668052 RepID=UPI0013D3D1E0|nr:helix-turn-helix domain-containing protein [Mangrovibacterium lignilyticum]
MYRVETQKSITEICFECGFHNISNFNRIFKKSQGCTPSEFTESYYGRKKLI